MKDGFGRDIDYLRVSLTERCNLRCTYCRADEGECPKTRELSAEEFTQAVQVFAKLGIRRVRLTGGEPLLRKDILQIVQNIAAIDGIEDLSITTNAQQLDGRASLLKQAGLKRVNISIDSLNPEKFRLMCSGNLDLVFNGIEEALAVGLTPVKLNVVLIRGRNDDEVDDFIEITRNKPVDVRFIELMPMGELGQDSSLRVNNAELIQARPHLKPLAPRYPSQPSRDFQVEGYLGRVGFISPHSQKFCYLCNRVRLMSDGKLRLCLGHNTEISVLDALHEGDEALESLISQAILLKPMQHDFNAEFVPNKNMSRIGG
jgi:cyclic pyranopterin phosphate synthase